MKKDNFILLLKNTERFTPVVIAELTELTEQYPYFAQPHILLAKAMHETNDLQAEKYLKRAGLYAADRRNLYYLLQPEKAKMAAPFHVERNSSIAGNYFELIEKVEAQGGDTKQSLKSLAEKLKAARQAISENQKEQIQGNSDTTFSSKKALSNTVKAVRIATPDYFNIEDKSPILEHEISEHYAKQLIKEKKFDEAIKILNELNFIYPKKSVYFADQIRFLEKILANTSR